jgi:RNA polymerase sigma-70 factor (ECF subfamily)
MLYSFDNHQTKTLRLPIAVADGEATDEELMARVINADENALAELYRRHTALLRTIVFRVINNEADTEDLLQEVFAEVWRMAASYSEEKGKALGWLVTLARRRAIDKLRRKQAYLRAEERMSEEVERDPSQHAHPSVEDTADAADRAEILRRVMDTLPAAQREALHLAFYRDMSQREIAAHTGIPLGTIKTRLELAVRKVRSAILAMGGAAEWGREDVRPTPDKRNGRADSASDGSPEISTPEEATESVAAIAR